MSINRDKAWKQKAFEKVNKKYKQTALTKAANSIKYASIIYSIIYMSIKKANNLDVINLTFLYTLMHCWERPSITSPNHAHMYNDQKEKIQSLWTERNRYVIKWDYDHDSDEAHLTSFGIEYQTEEEAKENERSPSVALLWAGLLRRGMVHELERVLRVCDGFLCSMSATCDDAVLLWQW